MFMSLKRIYYTNQSDSINRMITIADEIYLLIFSKWEFEMWSH